MGASEDITVRVGRRFLQTMSEANPQMVGQVFYKIDRFVYLRHATGYQVRLTMAMVSKQIPPSPSTRYNQIMIGPKDCDAPN